MIRNKVSESGLITLDLIDFCETGARQSIDLADWLENGLVIKEVLFKKRLQSLVLSPFRGKLVNVFCSSEAIIPTWAYLLMQAKLQKVAKDVFFGNKTSFELYLFQKKINSLNVERYRDKIVFIKSCKNKLLPVAAFSIIGGMLLPHVKSLFYGEPCSSVPLIKN